ncbi:uncharacterized protein LOC144171151 [Haemaphysalis longicornis]
MVTELLSSSSSSSETMLIVAPSNSAVDAIAHEATQCTEAEALLCLQYRTSSLVLVRDPMQLPAIVMSQEAVAHGFQESLFERFYKHLKQEADLKPIFNVYDGKLRPIARLEEAHASFPLTPYPVFNIADSPEASGMSWLICREAAFVARLCRAILDFVGVDLSLGVITLYHAQKCAIEELLWRLLPRGEVACDVNTVAGVQGQERDVIILSCVRAHHLLGQTDFFADGRSLNVAITRAKKALFICGHLDSLDTKEWGALVSGANDRCKVWDISAHCVIHVIAKIIRKPLSLKE